MTLLKLAYYDYELKKTSIINVIGLINVVTHREYFRYGSEEFKSWMKDLKEVQTYLQYDTLSKRSVGTSKIRPAK